MREKKAYICQKRIHKHETGPFLLSSRVSNKTCVMCHTILHQNVKPYGVDCIYYFIILAV